jgi:hypothetical protein
MRKTHGIGPLKRNLSGLVPKQVTTDEGQAVVWVHQPFCMPWDPALTRKYNTTGHFRLLNQLRSELKAQPIPRAESSDSGSASTRPVPSRTVEVRPQGNRFRRSYQASVPTSESNKNSDGPQTTFKERLSAIDMR